MSQVESEDHRTAQSGIKDEKKYKKRIMSQRLVPASDTELSPLPFSTFVLSDLHLEHVTKSFQKYLRRLPPASRAEVLILAGDIGNPEKPHYSALVKHCASVYPHVVVISGNHERWHSADGVEACRDVCRCHDNVHFLENETWTYKGITFVGCTFWTRAIQPDGAPVSQKGIDTMNDFKFIRNWSCRAHVTEHRRSRAFVQQMLCTHARCVVVTHHAPHFDGIASCFKGDAVNGLYASDCMNMLQSPNLVAWIFGHTHCTARWKVEATGAIVLTNAGRETDYSMLASWNTDSGVLSAPSSSSSPSRRPQGHLAEEGEAMKAAPLESEKPETHALMPDSCMELVETKDIDKVSAVKFALTVNTVGRLLGTNTLERESVSFFDMWKRIDCDLWVIFYDLDKWWTKYVVPHIPNMEGNTTEPERKKTMLKCFNEFMYSYAEYSFWQDNHVMAGTASGKHFTEELSKKAHAVYRNAFDRLESVCGCPGGVPCGSVEQQKRACSISRDFWNVGERGVRAIGMPLHRFMQTHSSS